MDPAAEAARADIPVPRELGGYEIIEPLGRGGMGVVYRAREPGTGRGVAVKTVATAGEGALAALRREILALSAIRHPGVVRILAEGMAGDRPWYAMELIVGRSLRSMLSETWQPTVSFQTTMAAAVDLDAITRETRTPRPAQPVTRELRGAELAFPVGSEGAIARPPILEIAPLLDHFARLCDPLAHVHAAGIVHRDLTPDNVIIRASGEPVLVDFGLAAAFRRGGREALSIGGSIVGTTHYMAPEQIRGEVVDARADLYSLGCMLYEALTGRPPFIAASPHAVLAHHLYDPPLRPTARDAAIPRWLDELVLALLAKDPRERIGYATDVAAILRREQGMVVPVRQADAAARPYVYRPRLIGRGEHVARFDPVIGALHDGRGGIVVVGGPSGVGKTRLAVELATRASAEGLRVVASECTALGADRGGRAQTRAAPLAPLRPFLQAVADRCTEHGPEAIERLLGDRAAVLATYEPALGRLPGVAALAPPPALSVEGTRARLFHCLRETLRALADDSPLVLLVDDVQWADELTLRFLDSLGADFFAATPAVILATHRTEEPNPIVDELRARPDTVVLDVGELGGDDVRAMVGDMLALREVPRPLHERLAGQAGGVPFHVGEYLRAAVEDGVLTRQPGGAWTLAGVALELPTSLPGLLRHRLARLAPLGRDVARVAAVLGREFDPALLAELTGAAGTAVDDAVRDLVHRNIFEEASRGRLRFGHDKLREAAYDDLDAAARRRAHHDAARALEQHAATDGHDLYPVLAHHYSMADEPARAVEFLEKAGARALAIGAYQDTVDFLRRALAMTARGVAVDRARRGRWQRWLGEAAWGLGDVDTCGEHFAAALGELDRPVPTTTGGWLTASVRHIAAQVRRRVRPTAAAGDADAGEAALAASRLSYRHYHAGENLPMIALVLRAVDLADRAGTAAQVAHPYQQLGYLAGLFRFPRIADHYFGVARARAEATRDDTNLAVTSYSEAMYLTSEGHCGEALRHAAAAVDVLRALGHAHELEVALSVQAHVEHNLGRYRDALAHCEELYASSRDRANRMHEAWGLYTVARERIALGDPAEGAELCALAEPLARASGDQASLVLLGGLRVLAEVRRGERAAAVLHADRWLALVEGSVPTVWSLGHGYAAAAEAAVDLALADGATAADRSRARAAVNQLWRHAAIFPVGRAGALVLEARLAATHRPRLAARLAAAAVARARAAALPADEAAGRAVLAACDAG